MDDTTEVQADVLGQEWVVAPEIIYANIEHNPSFDEKYDSEKDPNSETWRQFEQVAFKVLKEQNYIDIDEDGEIIVKPEKFADFSFTAFRDACLLAEDVDRSHFNAYATNSVSAITNLFWDRQVFIKGAEHYGKVPALAIPGSRTEGLNEEYLRNTTAAINLWNLGGSRMPEYYPTKVDGWDSALPTHDFVVGYLVLNHKIGGGIREDVSGREVLMVNYPDGRRRAVSANFFNDWGYNGKPTVDNLQINAVPYEFVLQHCQGLIHKGILFPQDFMRQTDVSFGIGARTVSAKGLVWTEGMAFTLGREYAGMQVYRMSPDLAAVVAKDDDGNHFVKAVFELNDFNDPDINLVEHWAGSRYQRVKKEGVVIYSQDRLEELFEKRTSAEYWTNNLDRFLSLSKKLAEVDVDVSSFALKEQILLLETYSDHPKYLDEFAKTYKENGLRALVFCQDVLGDVSSILEIGQYNTFSASEIYEEVAKLSEHIYALVGDGLVDDAWLQESKQKVVSVVLASIPLVNDIGVDYDHKDVVAALRELRRIEFDITEGGYLNTLRNYVSAEPDEKTMYLNRLVSHWEKRMIAEKRQRRVFEQGKKEVIGFYANINQLEQKAQETTGSAKQYEYASGFVQKVIDEAGKSKVKILDEGCGSGERITLPLSQRFPKTKFVGVDLRYDFVPRQKNLEFKVGDFTRLDDPDQTYDAIYSVWSPWMDVEGIEGQIQAAIEAHRVLKPGGRIMIEAADLEGEGKGWQEIAREHKRQNPDKPYGTIKVNVEGGVGERSFNIFPKEQLVAILEAVGFFEVELIEYKTENNVPRIVVYAKKP